MLCFTHLVYTYVARILVCLNHRVYYYIQCNCAIVLLCYNTHNIRNVGKVVHTTMLCDLQGSCIQDSYVVCVCDTCVM